jgi:sugar phosphate isomerase/epimerase
MDLGFLTVCLGNIPLQEKAKWAYENGFKTLEIACWPRDNDRDYSSSDIDVENLTEKEAERIKAYFKEYKLSISSLAYYDNNLHNDPDKRAFVNNHVKRCIDAAVMLETPTVGTFVGRNIDKNIHDNFDEYERVFGELVCYAEDRGIKIVIENCQMAGWQVPGLPGTISFTPELWEEMFRRIPNKNFGLNYDPSHLLIQLIDYLEPIKKFANRIFHFHAKDAEVFEDKLSFYGIYNKQLQKGPGSGYWMYRMPSLGQVNWEKVINILKEIGYTGVLSIEHEDPLYEDSIDKVKEGLMLGKKHLDRFM